MKVALCILGLIQASFALGATYDLPRAEFDLFGYQVEVEADYEDTLIDIARSHGIGQEEILRANPHIDRWLPGASTRVTIPARFILPSAPRDGLVLNLPEMRLYFFPAPEEGVQPQVQTYPVSIGRMDWSTPQGSTTIVSKQENPPWHPPESIREEHAREGDFLPLVVPPGPTNPLGNHALRLGIPGYLIHGTNKEYGVGMRVSHGCIRMLPEDIAQLFSHVQRGTPVHIINQPVKAGWYGGDLFLEVHPPLEEYPMEAAALEAEANAALDRALSKRYASIDAQALENVLARKSGMPEVVSKAPISR